MANEGKPGYKGKVTIGLTKVLGMGVWSISGHSRDTIEETEFDGGYGKHHPAIGHRGILSFDGNYKKDDATGQDIMASALLNDSIIQDIQFWVDEISYLMPNSTTAAGGGLLAEEGIAHVIVLSHDIDFDHTAMGSVSFSVQLTHGPLRMV